jgi:thioesterase domain-containing protein
VTLPEYMIPTSFVFLDALPRTPNGKVDRTALPRPDRTTDLLQPYEAPVGGTEEKLAGILVSLLKVPRVGRNDGFFDLGGHSILAVSFFNEIERAFGPRLPLATLFRAPTIEAIAATIETELRQPRAWSSLVPMQPTGARPRFFCVHGAGGNVLLYRDLARRLGGEYPFYGLQSQGLDGKAPPLATVEEMAAKYVSEITEFQPEGPYCLGGYCLGGKIAYEMAQILSRNGHDVALLVLMDSYNLTHTRQPRLLGYLRQKMVFHLRNLAHMEAANWAGYLKEKMRVAHDGELLSIWKNLRDSVKGIGTREDRPPTAASLQEVNDRAAAIYSPKPYSGRVTLVKPRANYEFLPDPNMGWGDLALGGLDLVEVAANPHAMLVEPYVNVLATELMARLCKVQSRSVVRSLVVRAT